MPFFCIPSNPCEGYILIPYLGEPFATVFLTFWLGLWRVGVDPRIGRSYAERLMMAPEMDLVNPAYNDLICTTSAFFVTFFAPSVLHWKLFGCLVVWSAFLYCQNRYRLLRWQTFTPMSTKLLACGCSMSVLQQSFSFYPRSLFSSSLNQYR